MKFTAEQIAEILEGKVAGNPKAEVFKLSKIEEGDEGSLTFLANMKYKQYIYSTKATIVIVSEDFEPESPILATLIKVKDAYSSFSKLLEFYNQVKRNKVGIEPQTYISPTAKYGKDIYLGSFAYIGDDVIIGDNVKIYPNCYIGDSVTIGNNVTLFAGAKIYSDCVIGNNCIIHSGAVIGADGFGFAQNPENKTYSKIPQIGNVILEDNVDVGANSTIDRATLGSTIIHSGTKIDNLVMIAHNVEIGENTVVISQVGISGSTKIGKNCIIAGQAGIIGHITIGDNARILAKAGVARNIKEKETVMGAPAMNYVDFNRAYIHFKNLPKIVKEIEDLKRNVEK